MRLIKHKKFKKLLPILTFSFVFIFSFLILSNAVFAQYEPLQELPGISSPDAESGNFAEYMIGMVNLLIGVAAVLAVIFVTIGGLQYVTTDSISNKESGKETIQNALLGLLLALASWLLLYTINPDLVDTFEIFGNVT